METTINVQRSLQGKFGPQVQLVDGKYLGFGKFYKGETELPAGAHKVDLYTSPKGNGYINALMTAGEPVAKQPWKAAVEAASVLRSRDFDSENRGKTRCALLAAVLSNPSLVTNLASMTEFFKELDKCVDYVFKTRKDK